MIQLPLQLLLSFLHMRIGCICCSCYKWLEIRNCQSIRTCSKLAVLSIGFLLFLCFCCLLPLISCYLNSPCSCILLINEIMNILVKGNLLISFLSPLIFLFCLNQKIQIVTTSIAHIHFWKGWRIIFFFLNVSTGSWADYFLMLKHRKQIIMKGIPTPFF
jgi:hypothetical protein